MVQAADLAGEYAAKLAKLHEESAIRAEGDLRKRQQRYVMLANLQAQAEVQFLWMLYQHCKWHSILHKDAWQASLDGDIQL